MPPILSICIPTFNRAGYLYFTLKSIVEQDFFKNTNDIEIIVSDNCSEDSTEKITKIFLDKFPDKIVYHRNETNISDLNFEKALSLGRGEVLKLHNDNFLFFDGALESIVNKIKALREEKTMIFFANGNSQKNKDTMCDNLSEFLDAASYLSGWIASFSMWKEDFDKFNDFSKNVSTCFMQTDVLLRIIANGKKTLVCNEKIFYGQGILQKGGGNIAKLFGKNYLSIFKPYVENKTLDKKVYEKEKKLLLLNHIIPMKFYDSLKNEYSWFVNDGYSRYLIKDYWYNLYFYTSIFKIIRLAIDAQITLFSHKLNPNQYKRLWRKRNKHNQTTLSKNVDITKIFIGKNCTGEINVEFSNNPNELLIIDDNVVIDDDFKFVFDSSELIIVSNETQTAKCITPQTIF